MRLLLRHLFVGTLAYLRALAICTVVAIVIAVVLAAIVL